MFSNILIYAVLRNWEMVLPVIYYTRVKKAAIVTEKIARHLSGPMCFKAKFKWKGCVSFELKFIKCFTILAAKMYFQSFGKDSI